jgi:sulfur-oxidizing protein SoxX
MKLKTLALAAVTTALLSACATYSPPSEQESMAVIMSSFRDRGIATTDRLNQSELQKICTETGNNPPKAERERLEKAALAAVKYPTDGKWLGDYTQGERIAQTGVGMQWTDAPGTPAGGNCYACHELSKAEISYGNIGPSLNNYGKLRGYSDEIKKYTWAKIWNTHAFNACSSMPRFGDAGILTEQQIKDVMALLLDPKSPVNK